MNKKEIQHYTAIFKGLGNPTRLKILMHIAKCKNHNHKHNISELCQECDVEYSVVSRHLKVLKDVGILKSLKQKNDVIYTFNRKELKQYISEFTTWID